MASHLNDRNGTSATYGGHLGIGTAMYNGLVPSPMPYAFAAGPQGMQARDEIATAMNQMSMGGYPSNLGNVAPNGLVPMGMNSLMGGGQTYYYLPDGRIIPSRLPNAAFQQSRNENTNPNVQSHQTMHIGPTNAGPVVGNHQHALPWNVGQQFKNEANMPGFASPRRNSHSSNEENGPRTPHFGASQQVDALTKVVIGDSPYPWTTPSPHMSAGSPQFQIAKSPTGQYYFTNLTALCLQEPPIPKPIPAIFSGEKGRGTLEKSLQNNLNTTNVYIRGLHPNTTDEMLSSYGSRFGKIISAKSMLDQENGNCKGFGFIKYHNFHDGENCIRAFFHWGYEAKWARVSHNEKLKTLGDDNNTNLYCSNLPLEFNEHCLMSIFDGFEVLSAKILRDTNGMSRGVGFARFGTPEICRKVIERWNGMKVGDEGFFISIRFADTPEQKKLKSITAERRNYKATEYNAAVYSPGSPYASTVTPAVYANSPLQARATPALWTGQNQVGSVYSAYHSGGNTSYLDSPKVALAPGPENVDLAARYLARTSIGSPSSIGLSKRSGNLVSPAKSDIGILSESNYPLSNQGDVKSSPIKPNNYSPLKPSPSKGRKSMLRS